MDGVSSTSLPVRRSELRKKTSSPLRLTAQRFWLWLLCGEETRKRQPSGCEQLPTPCASHSYTSSKPSLSRATRGSLDSKKARRPSSRRFSGQGACQPTAVLD